MKARAFALMIIALLIWAMAAAGIADDIDNCCFVDRQCNSDQDWINGWHAYENNQCSAPAQSGAPTSSQPTGGTPAQIDNCCFVDRQCSSDQEWAAGYYAFQNNQCRAPGQSPASATSQSASGVILRTASGVVIGYRNGRGILPTTAPNVQHGVIRSNCCHSQNTWQCNSDQDQAEGYRAYQTNLHCSLPGLISIVGDPDFVTYYEQRLDLLKNRLPQRYDYVLNYLDKIEQDRTGLNSHVSTDPRIYYVKWGGAPVPDGWEKRESAVLVHEACHIHRHDAGFGYASSVCDHEVFAEEEVICMGVELEVMNELGAPAHIMEWLRGVIELTRAGKNTYYQTPGC
ncbi:MAG: hypothetical protein OXE52_18380 [Chloroflexi bacterium]|nr:hypothetical protein [Chloroflexota bacterium]